MGRITEINGGAAEISVAHRRRFARYFPGLFAYVRAMSDDYATSVDNVVSAFETALSEPHANEEAFVLSLFAHARELCGMHSTAHDTSEREVLSLTFDAQLDRSDLFSLVLRDVQVVDLTLNEVDHTLADVRHAVGYAFEVVGDPDQVGGALNRPALFDHEHQ